jgi:hypothetical protein
MWKKYYSTTSCKKGGKSKQSKGKTNRAMERANRAMERILNSS